MSSPSENQHGVQTDVRTPHERALKTDLFTFIVEPDDGLDIQEFYVDPEPVARCSDVLDRLIHGNMMEAEQKSARIFDTDPETFSRFIDWLYTETYTGVGYDPPKESAQPTEETTTANEGMGGETAADGQAGAPTGSSQTPETPAVVAPRGVIVSESEKLKYKEPYLMAHARVCCFAEKYNIEMLRRLAENELVCILQQLSIPRQMPEVIELLTYAYENTPDRKGGPEAIDPLRVAIMAGLCRRVGKVVREESYEDLQGEFGCMSFDLLRVTIDRRLDQSPFEDEIFSNL